MSNRENIALGKVRANEIDVKTLTVGGDPQNGTAGGGMFTTATFTIGAEAANVINVACQLEDSAGDAVTGKQLLYVWLSDDAAAGSIAATAPDGGVAEGSAGTVFKVHVAGKEFAILTDANGTFNLDITESGTDTFYMGVKCGATAQLIASGAITFAA